MSPEDSFEATRKQKEEETLSAMVSSLSQSEKEEVFAKGVCVNVKVKTSIH